MRETYSILHVKTFFFFFFFLFFKGTYHLFCDHDYSLYGEPTVAMIEYILETGA